MYRIPTIVALLLVSCGSDHAQPDLSSSALMDLSEAIDTSPALSPPDLFRFCTTPNPGLYLEQPAGLLSSPTQPMPTSFASNVQAVAQNDGLILHLFTPIIDPAVFHCDDMRPDARTCEAPCCDGVDAPVIVFFPGGYVLLKTGTCKRPDPNKPDLIWTYKINLLTGKPFSL